MTNGYILKEKNSNKNWTAPKQGTLNNILQFSKSLEVVKCGKDKKVEIHLN